MLHDTGARLSKVAKLELDDVDLSLGSVRFHGKGAKDRRPVTAPLIAVGGASNRSLSSSAAGSMSPALPAVTAVAVMISASESMAMWPL